MTLAKTEAIVLKTAGYGEDHRIVNCFTLNFGKLKFAVKGVHSKKNRFGASLEPMMLSRMVFYDHPAREILMLSQADIINAFPLLRKDIKLMSWGLYMVELTDELTAERDRSEDVFFLLKNTFANLSPESEWKMLIKYFELKFFKICGYELQLANCVECRGPIISKNTYCADINKGGILCEKCQKNISFMSINISGETLKILELFSSISIDKVNRLIVSERAFEELEGLMDLYRKKYLSRELKSLDFIRNINI
ncbi:DNA repair protein RecO [Candidatus Desantisbacteria bacterium]|nr:DNA repair protein RecO [Candidatus Desantisbacteria bacterium]